jgi:hypothetical protein
MRDSIELSKIIQNPTKTARAKKKTIWLSTLKLQEKRFRQKWGGRKERQKIHRNCERDRWRSALVRIVKSKLQGDAYDITKCCDQTWAAIKSLIGP